MTVSSWPDDARLVSVPVERLRRWIDNFADRHGPLDWSRGDCVVAVSAADGTRAWFEVPFPPLPKKLGVATDLIAHARLPRRVGVILVRRGGHAAGVFDGATLIASKVGASYVQGATKAGGWSQQRFARRRDNQARAAFAEAADIAVRVLSPFRSELLALYTGGDRAAVEAVLADPRLDWSASLRQPPFLITPDPRLRVLQATPEQFRIVLVHVYP